MLVPVACSLLIHAAHSAVYTTSVLSVSVSAVSLDLLSAYHASWAAFLCMAVLLAVRHKFRKDSLCMINPALHKATAPATASPASSPLTTPVSAHTPHQARLLTYNFFCRPPFVSNNGNDYKNERLALFIQELNNYDIIAMQEMFELMNGRQEQLIAAAREAGFAYALRGKWPSFFHTKFVDSGLLILSRYPILRHDFHIFQQGALIDKFSAKQVMYAEIALGSTRLHLFTAHTQATYALYDNGAPSSGNAFYDFGQNLLGISGGQSAAKECDRARESQFREIRNFVDRILDGGRVLDDSSHVAVLAGDLNTDALNTPCEYDALVSLLSEGAQYSVRNLLEAEHGEHPITMGDYCAATRAPKETLLTSVSDQGAGMCLDYIFVLEGDGTRREGSVQRVSVHSSRVEPFFVSCPSGLSQLSDHYGLSATVSVSHTHQ
jgi:endonuclease/exonuclease/phosphatase family metal-dependent hydrolase